MTQLSAIIFDLDGTLIDSTPDITAALNRYLTANGWPEQAADFIGTLIGYGPRKLLVDVFATIGHPTDEASVKAAHLAYLEHYRAAPAERTVFYPHVRDDLVSLQAAGFRLGICTNKLHALTKQVLDAFGIASLFEVALGADAVPACKPDPAHLTAVTGHMGVGIKEIAYVGDTIVDQRTAQAAGAAFLCVPWGNGAALDVSASQRLTRLSDIPERFAALQQIP